MTTLVHEKETYAILGACFEVYREKGCGFFESGFQECVGLEFDLQRIPARAQVPLLLKYKGRPLAQRYIADYICYDKVVLELKAVSQIAAEHRAQIQNYLHATVLTVASGEFWSFPESGA